MVPRVTKDELFKFRCTDEEKTFLEEAAGQEKLDAAAWGRRVLLLEAERILGRPAPTGKPAQAERPSRRK